MANTLSWIIVLSLCVIWNFSIVKFEPVWLRLVTAAIVGSFLGFHRDYIENFFHSLIG